jgi:hypothetical protein
VGLEEAVDLREGGERLLQVIEAKLYEGVVTSHGFGGREELFDGVSAERQADLGEALGHESRRNCGR